MNHALLEILRCPFCSLPFHLTTQRTDERGEVESGILTCECHRFPILFGIPILQDDDQIPTLVNLVESGNTDEALVEMLHTGLSPLLPRVRRIVPLIMRLPGAHRLDRALARRHVRRWIGRDGEAVTFADFARAVNPYGAAYFTFRFTDPTFLTSLAMAGIMRQGWPILDVGCGAGHFAYAISNWLGLGPVVGLDRVFRILYMAKRFLIPTGTFVCCHADRGLPFAGGAFGYVMSSDAFHYVAAKRVAAAEMTRVVRRDGAVILTHLHNKRGTNPSPGWPLTPEGYAALFPGMGVAFLRDSAVLEAFLAGRPFDLAPFDGTDTVGDEPSISLIATHDQAVFAAHDAPDLSLRYERLQINPLYGVQHVDSEVRLTLRFPSPRYEAEFGGIRRYLPERVSIPQRYLTNRSSPEIVASLEPLVRRWILVDLPDRYI